MIDETMHFTIFIHIVYDLLPNFIFIDDYGDAHDYDLCNEREYYELENSIDSDYMIYCLGLLNN